jgi:hypothetical protein
MIRIVSLIWHGFVAGFKSRHQLLIENWSLRHQLQAAQLNLIRAGMHRGGIPSRLHFQSSGEDRIGRPQRVCIRFFDLFASEEPRICLLLMLVAVVLLGANVARAVRTFAPATDTANIWPQLDSFSEPALAEAVIRSEAEKLLVNYSDGYDAYLQSLDSWKRKYSAWLAASGLFDCAANARRYETEARKKPAFSVDAWISRFKATLSALRERPAVEGLEHTLLLLYERDGRWSEFIDLYLEIIRKSPENLDVVGWAEAALRHATECGRADQVLAHLQFAAKYYRLSLQANLGPILKRWSQLGRADSPLAFNWQGVPQLSM